MHAEPGPPLEELLPPLLLDDELPELPLLEPDVSASHARSDAVHAVWLPATVAPRHATCESESVSSGQHDARSAHASSVGAGSLPDDEDVLPDDEEDVPASVDEEDDGVGDAVGVGLLLEPDGYVDVPDFLSDAVSLLSPFVSSSGAGAAQPTLTAIATREANEVRRRAPVVFMTRR